MTPQQYCINKTKESNSSFLSAFYFLGYDKRMALTALYAFCREVDEKHLVNKKDAGSHQKHLQQSGLDKRENGSYSEEANMITSIYQ